MNKPQVLLVEDDVLLSEAFSEILTLELEAEVECILDGQQALERLNGAVADVILLDLHLPKVSGIEVLHHIRGSEQWAGVPVIFMSADAFRIKEVEEQAELTLIKPISYEDLISYVSRLMVQN